jgi:hypothetical protein
MAKREFLGGFELLVLLALIRLADDVIRRMAARYTIQLSPEPNPDPDSGVSGFLF